ncbi:unnamed protein product [Blepharisma stoltei]|uniref:Uncharacterized protein n=1 Tax=Blepharisma stoltei TaxID=1481888 RepID=A0AAU9K9A9_9CILI|nr:unnamed protein product [Blepharisma stoltei]
MSHFYQIALLGAGGVGKSDLILRFTQNRFEDCYDPTIEDQYTKNLELDGKAVKLEILDTAGQEEFSHLINVYLEQREAFLLVYSIIDTYSLEYVKKLCQMILEKKRDIPIMIIGNKADLDKNRRVKIEEIQEIAKLFKYCSYIEASAKLNFSVTESFIEIVRLIWKKNVDNLLEIEDKEIEIEVPLLNQDKALTSSCCSII